MKSSDAPSKQSVPFGVNGSRQSILDTTPTGSNAASYDVGFPPITMILKSAGGLPPLGQNWNQILYELSGISRFLSAGGGYVYDSTFATAVSGYPAGAVIPNSTLNGLWVNTVDDNSTNPENSTSALTGWVPAYSSGITALTGLSSASVTLGTLDASKDRITLSGTLTSNINIVLPAWIKKWDIINNCAGSFSVTVKTSSGTGVAVPAQSNATVFGDGTNIVASLPPGTLIKATLITANGTFTPQSYTRSMMVESVGGGGGGGGLNALTSVTAHCVSGGGGAGGTAKAWITQVANSYNAVIGAGGSGGNSSGTAGTNGGQTSFGSVCTATGGAGGGPGNSAAISNSNALVASGGNAGVGVVGNFSLGSYESAGIAVAAFASNIGSGGGSTPYGSGGARVGISIQGVVAGNNGSGYGAGGGGCAAYSASAVTPGVAGGNGTQGCIIVFEYS